VAAPTPPQVEPRPVEVIPAEDDRYVGPSSAALAAMTIRQRIEILQQFHPEAAEQLALDTVHQFMMARTTVDVIATRMGYSVGWVIKKREALRKRFKEQAEALDVKNYMMGMLDQLQEITGMAMREAAIAAPAEYGRRLSGIQVARRAVVDQAKLLQLGGAFETAPLRPVIAPDDNDPAAALKELSRNFLSHVYEATGRIAPGDTIIDNDDEREDDE